MLYTNSLPSRPSTVGESSCKVSRHFRLSVHCIRRVPIWVGGGARGGKDGDSIFLNRKVYGCIRPSYGPHKPLDRLK